MQLIYQRPHIQTLFVFVEVPEEEMEANTEDEIEARLRELITDADLETYTFTSEDLYAGEFEFSSMQEITAEDESARFRLVNGVIEKIDE